MSALSVRVSEDPARPLGHAIITLGGLPRSLETFEFALRRHGFSDNYLGPDGWQGAECWLQPQEVWYSGEALKFVIHPDLAFQLENMPYRLAVRGQGLASVADVTFTWPPQLEIEAGAASSERRVVGGARVEAGPKLPPEPPPKPKPVAPEVGHADLPIPDMPIPDLGFSAEPVDENLPTRVAPSRPSSPPSPKPADDDETTRVVTPGARSSSTNRTVPADAEPTVSVPGRKVPPPVPAELAPKPESPTRTPSPAAPPGATDEPRRGKSGWLIGLLILAVLAVAVAAGWWWFSHRGAPTPPLASPVAVPPVRAYASPEPVPAPEPKPAPEPVPAPEPKPAPEPVPAPEPAIPVRSTPPAPLAAPPVPPAATSPPAAPSQPPGSGRSLEDELKSQFDPTVQELEKRLHRPKSP